MGMGDDKRVDPPDLVDLLYLLLADPGVYEDRLLAGNQETVAVGHLRPVGTLDAIKVLLLMF